MIDNGQPKLTSFFPIINDIERLLKKNVELEKTLERFVRDNLQNINADLDNSSLLNNLFHISSNKSNKNRNHQYSHDMKMFGSFLYIDGNFLHFPFSGV